MTDLISIDSIIRETPKAYLAKCGDQEAWIPKKAMNEAGEVKRKAWDKAVSWTQRIADKRASRIRVHD